MRANPVLGTVIRYDRVRGVAQVTLDDGRSVPMHTAGFISGRPARHPTPGDRISCILSYGENLCVAAARPIRRVGG